jgi:hypothetical protein
VLAPPDVLYGNITGTIFEFLKPGVLLGFKHDSTRARAKIFRV